MLNKKLAPSRIADQFMLRFPDGLRDRCKELAKKNHRSLNAELISRIEKSMEAQDARVN